MSTYDMAVQNGFVKGVERGIEQGIEQGIEKGIDLGADKNARQVAKKLLLEFPTWGDDKVADLSNTTIEVVQSIRREL
jgi:hypothetical protein